MAILLVSCGHGGATTMVVGASNMSRGIRCIALAKALPHARACTTMMQWSIAYLAVSCRKRGEEGRLLLLTVNTGIHKLCKLIDQDVLSGLRLLALLFHFVMFALPVRVCVVQHDSFPEILPDLVLLLLDRHIVRVVVLAQLVGTLKQ